MTRALVLEVPVERLFSTLIDGSRGLEAGEVTVPAGLSSDDLGPGVTIEVPVFHEREK